MICASSNVRKFNQRSNQFSLVTWCNRSNYHEIIFYDIHFKSFFMILICMKIFLCCCCCCCWYFALFYKIIKFNLLFYDPHSFWPTLNSQLKLNELWILFSVIYLLIFFLNFSINKNAKLEMRKKRINRRIERKIGLKQNWIFFCRNFIFIINNRDQNNNKKHNIFPLLF